MASVAASGDGCWCKGDPPLRGRCGGQRPLRRRRRRRCPQWPAQPIDWPKSLVVAAVPPL